MTIFASNRELLDGFRRGESQSLTLVYKHYVSKVAACIARGFQRPYDDLSVPGVESAELQREYVQEVFLRAFSEAARQAYDGIRAYQPYLMQIARNLLIDHWRKQGREIEISYDDQAQEEWEYANDSREMSLVLQSRILATREYLKSLSPLVREFVKLRFEQELSQYEIKDRLGLTRWKVRTLEKKVLAGLSNHLKRKDLTRPP
jgi:RNA polymerase sigma-70 factor (ECF subfamily)